MFLFTRFARSPFTMPALSRSSLVARCSPQVVRTDIFETTNHARSPSMIGGRSIPNSNRTTPGNTPQGIGLKSIGLQAVLDVKTQDMSLLFGGEGVTQLLDGCLGEMSFGGAGGAGEAGEAGGGADKEAANTDKNNNAGEKGERQFAMLFGGK